MFVTCQRNDKVNGTSTASASRLAAKHDSQFLRPEAETFAVVLVFPIKLSLTTDFRTVVPEGLDYIGLLHHVCSQIEDVLDFPYKLLKSFLVFDLAF